MLKFTIALLFAQVLLASPLPSDLVKIKRGCGQGGILGSIGATAGSGIATGFGEAAPVAGAAVAVGCYGASSGTIQGEETGTVAMATVAGDPFR